MSIFRTIVLPNGFEQLTKDEQIDYVQNLWDLILTTSSEITSPEWHIEIVCDRIASQDSTQLSTWKETKQRLIRKYCE